MFSASNSTDIICQSAIMHTRSTDWIKHKHQQIDAESPLKLVQRSPAGTLSVIRRVEDILALPWTSFSQVHEKPKDN